jgi:gamma-glutamylcyclotransferase (GGCT)/AIG2-like uncharacterized protein YtfP
MAREPSLLFVYGTLRRASGHGMHQVLEAGAELLGSGRVRGTLFDLGPYPGMTLEPEGESGVRGEVYRLSPAGADELLRRLDAYEGIRAGEVAGCEYRRGEVEVRLDDGDRVRAWAYLLTRVPPGARALAAGDYLG